MMLFPVIKHIDCVHGPPIMLAESKFAPCVDIELKNKCWKLDRLLTILMDNATKPAINTFRPRENGRHFADDIFKGIFLNENVWIPI